jgi:hypothetical protein
MIVMLPDCGGIPAAYVKSARGLAALAGLQRGPSGGVVGRPPVPPAQRRRARDLHLPAGGCGSGRRCTCPIRGPRPRRSSSAW